MNWQERENLSKKTAAVVQEIAEMGINAGHWQRVETRDSGPNSRHDWLTTPDGIPFVISGGGWGQEKRVSIRLRSAHEPGTPFFANAPDDSAGFSAERDKEAILRGCVKFLKSETTQEAYSKMLASLANSVVARASLMKQVEQMEALGLEVHGLREDEVYKANLYKKGMYRQFSVTRDGQVTTEITLPVEKMAALLKLLETE